MRDSQAKEGKEAADAFCKLHVKTCCAELLEFRKTGLLRNGRVRELSALMSSGQDDSLELAEWAGHVERCASVRRA